MQQLPEALAPFAAWKQFIVYLVRPSSRPGKFDKFPADFRTGRVINAHDPQFWTDAQTAIAAAATFGASYGVAFVFTSADPFWFLDIDECLQADGTWSPLAVALCQAFAGCAVEVSHSGRGLHVFGSGPVPTHGSKNVPLRLEFYTSARFVALTGTNAVGSAAVDASATLPWLVANYFPPIETAQASDWNAGPVPEWRGPADDDELIRRMLLSRSARAAFGGASFADLWHANAAVLGKAYPADGRPFDASSADAALAQHLAFWTGKDCERMRRIMLRSKLARDKWEREDYLPRTILSAAGRQFEVLTDREPAPPAIEPPPPGVQPAPAVLREGSHFVDIPAQLQWFAGCTYIGDLHKVLIPGGHLVKPDRFRVIYGGSLFPLDTGNERVSRDAWECFTQSNAWRPPTAEGICFRPELEPGKIVTRDGMRYANTYWPVDVARQVGDCSPFLEHLEKVLPVERDRAILLAYMAACVQHKGVKFQWAPLLQGVEGNGKTLFTRCVAEAVGRRYVHWPKASKLSKEFNAWMVGKLLYGVEDIYTPSAKAEVIEELKPMITGGDGLEIEGKGVDQISADICGNFMFNSNHRDAVRKTENDRRFCVMFSAQQEKADLARDGMTGNYFPDLYTWLRGGGYAIVSELLHTMPIPPEFNPAGLCQRAPDTSSTASAIAASAGGIEQEIAEAIGQGLPGFCGGWISSIMLDRLLDRLGLSRRITHNRRRELLAAQGYVPHPALSDGRVNNQVMPDGGKPRLYVRKTEHAILALRNASEVARTYEQANNRAHVPFGA